MSERPTIETINNHSKMCVGNCFYCRKIKKSTKKYSYMPSDQRMAWDEPSVII